MIEGNPLIELLLWTVMLIAACGCGRIAVAFLGIRDFSGRLEHNVISFGLGGIVVGAAALFLGLFHLFVPFAAATVLVLLFIAGLVGCAIPLLRAASFEEKKPEKGLSLFSIAVGAVFLVFAGFNLVNALVPTLNNDTLNLYFWCPKVWIQQNAIIDIKLKFVDNITFWISALHAFCMLLSSEVLAKLFNVYGPGILSSLVVFMLARRYLKREVAVLAAAIYYCSYCNVWICESGRPNFAMAFYELSAMYCFFVWLDSAPGKGKRWIILAAIFSGFAVGIHISSMKTVITITLLVAVTALRAKRMSLGSLARLLAVFFAVCLVMAAPLLLRNYATTGNPTYPLLHRVFGGEEYAGIYGPNIMSRGQQTPIVRDFFCKLWDITMRPYPATRSNTPNPLILVFVPLFLLVRGAPKRVWQILGVALLIYVLWFFTQRMARYGYDYLSLLSIAAAYTICAFLESRKPVVVLVTLAALLLVFGMDMERNLRFFRPFGMRVKCALGLYPRREFLISESTKRPFSPQFFFCDYINRNTPPDAVVFGTTEVEEYWFDRTYLSVREKIGEGFYYEKSPEEMLRRLRENGVTHVLYSRRYVNAVNSWMKACNAVDGEFYPRDNLFENDEFAGRHLNRLIERDSDVLYEVRYTDDEAI